MTARTLQSILYRKIDGSFALAFCRASPKCQTDPKLQSLAKRPCPNCYIPPRDDMTLKEVAERIAKGDA